MSTQNIETLSRERYFQEAEENLLRMSDAYFYKKKFFIGAGVNKDERDFYMQNHRYLCTEDCSMIKYIQKKIEGRLEQCGHKCRPKQSLQCTLDKFTKIQNCSEDECINECVNLWSQNDW